jgi:hypothetical protein
MHMLFVPLLFIGCGDDRTPATTSVAPSSLTEPASDAGEQFATKAAQNPVILRNADGKVIKIFGLALKGGRYTVTFAAGGMSYSDAFAAYGSGSILATSSAQARERLDAISDALNKAHVTTTDVWWWPWPYSTGAYSGGYIGVPWQISTPVLYGVVANDGTHWFYYRDQNINSVNDSTAPDMSWAFVNPQH